MLGVRGERVCESSTGGRRVLGRNQWGKSDRTRGVVWCSVERGVAEENQRELPRMFSEKSRGADARRVVAASRVMELELGRDGSDPHLTSGAAPSEPRQAWLPHRVPSLTTTSRAPRSGRLSHGERARVARWMGPLIATGWSEEPDVCLAVLCRGLSHTP